MTACVECGKKLGFFEGYNHPTLGRKNLVCGSCFLKIDASVTQWREFILSNSFNPESAIPGFHIHQRLNSLHHKALAHGVLHPAKYEGTESFVPVGGRMV